VSIVTAGARYLSFPQDDRLYWLRWIDGVDIHGRGTGSPTLEALLSPLTGNNDAGRLPNVRDIAKTSADVRRCHVHAGSLPALTLGSVFQNGKRVGAVGLDTRSFSFKRDSCSAQVVLARSGSEAAKPYWWDLRPWTVLPPAHYSLPWFDYRCLHVHAGRAQLILPCSEVFRVFCAPETRMANALLSGSWEVVRNRVVNDSWIDKLPDRWEIGLRTGVTGRSAAAAVAIEMTDHGRAVAYAIYAALIGGAPGRKPLVANIPFDWRSIELQVEGLDMGMPGFEHFLTLRIVKVRWPDPIDGFPPRIDYRLDNYNTVREPHPEPPGDPRPPLVSHESLLDEDGDADVTPDDDPDVGAGLNTLSGAEGPVFEGGPAVERMPLEESKGGGRGRPTRSEPAGVSSTAAGPGADRGVAGISHSPGGPLPVSSLSVMFAALNALVGCGITRWDAVRAQEDKFAFVENHPVWVLPGFIAGAKSRWSYIGLRRRRCLLARVELGNRVVHLAELERRPGSTEGFSLLLFRSSPDQVQLLMSSLLRHAALKNGVWPRDPSQMLPQRWTGSGVALMRRDHPFEPVASDVTPIGFRALKVSFLGTLLA